MTILHTYFVIFLVSETRLPKISLKNLKKLKVELSLLVHKKFGALPKDLIAACAKCSGGNKNTS